MTAFEYTADEIFSRRFFLHETPGPTLTALANSHWVSQRRDELVLGHRNSPRLLVQSLRVDLLLANAQGLDELVHRRRLARHQCPHLLGCAGDDGSAIFGKPPLQLGEYVDPAGLMSYGPHMPDLFRRAGEYVDKILRGAKAGDLPVELPTKFELVVNLTVAKALGLKLPESFLLRADEVIE